MTRHLPIIAVLVVQVGALGWIVGGQLYVRATGVPVTLITAPIDPYDVMSGYYLDIHYQIEDRATERVRAELELPDDEPERGERLWLTVRKAPTAWVIVSVGKERPPPKQDHASLPAVWRGRVILSDARRIYLPEAQRAEAEALLEEHARSGLVDLRVGSDGSVAVLRLRLGERTFGE